MKKPLVTMALGLISGEILCIMEYRFISIIIYIMLCFYVFLCNSVDKGRILGVMIYITMSIVGFVLITKQVLRYEKYDTEREEGSTYIDYGIVKDIDKSDYGCGITIEDKEGFNYVCLYLQENQVKEIEIEDSVKVEYVYEKLKEAPNYGAFDSREYYYSIGICGYVKGKSIEKIDSIGKYKNYLARCSAYMHDNLLKYLNKDKAEVMTAIITGNKGGVDKETRDMYKNSGIAHILAISGLHISIVGACIYKVLKRYLSCNLAIIVSLVVMISYGVLTGESVSAMRAVIMYIMMLTARIAGRKYDICSSISMAAILLLIMNPSYIYNASYILSFSAVVCIALIYPIIKEFYKIKNKYVSMLMSSIVISFLNAPLISYFFYELPIYAFLINLLVIPLMSVLLIAGLCVALVGEKIDCLSSIAAYMCDRILEFYYGVCNIFGNLPYSRVVTGKPRLSCIVIFYIIVCIVVVYMKRCNTEGRRDHQYRCKKRYSIIAVLIPICAMVIVYTGITHKVISFINVGQGDCSFIRDRDGVGIMVDCGSSSIKNVAKNNVIPHIKALGVQKIDYVFLSHTDSDHISGIIEIVENELIDICNIVFADLDESMYRDNDNYMKIIKLAEEKGIAVNLTGRGDVYDTDNMHIEVLYPLRGSKDEDINDLSLVMKVCIDGQDILYTGDISGDVEQKLVRSGYIPTDIDILKVAHHGSVHSTTGIFLDRIVPHVCIISYGKNSYGHPSEDTKKRITSRGSSLYETYYGGIMLT